MKKLFVNFMLVAVAAMAFVSCSNDIDNTPVFDNEELITVTLKADKTCTRTEMIEGVPYWSKGDAIGAYFYDGKDYKNYKFTNDSDEASLTTTFTGQTAVSDVFYVYYPYTSNGASEKGAKVDIPVTQYPTATSFDGAADIMIAKPITLKAGGTQLENLEFARLGAIVKIVLKDNTSKLSNQHISSLTMTAESNLVGRVYLDAENQTLGELYHGKSMSVTANYDAEPLAIDGDNAIYLIVYPQTLTVGSKLKFEASTEGYAIAKSITLPQDIELIGGAVNTLNVSINAEHLTAEDAGLALPFEDDFSWATGNVNAAFTTSDLPKFDNGNAMYSDCGYIYPYESTALKFSSGDYGGTLTTSELNLSEPFSVVVNAKYYSTTEKTLTITVGEQAQNVTLTADYADYIVEFDAVSAKETVKISGGKKQRFYLNDLKIVAGHDYVLPPVLTVSTYAESVSSGGGEFKFTYSVANPVEGTNVDITDNVDWITTSDASGTVTVTVAANTAEEKREGVITVEYGELSKTITVMQAAPSTGGETTVELSCLFANNSTSDWTNSYAAHTFTYDDYAKIVFSAASKQTGTITTMPVTKNGTVDVVMTNSATISSVIFNCEQWGSKTQKMELYYSTNGSTYTKHTTDVTWNDYTLTCTNLPANTIAVRAKGTSSSNQIGIESVTITYKN